jgi:CPA1 family monovalent cation:H+ antiporter
VVPLAAALSIPLTTAQGSGLPQRDLVLVLAAAAIVFSLVVQGFTLEPLARFAGFGASAAGPGHEETLARLRMAEAAMARLDELAEAGAVPDTVIDRLRDGLQAGAGPARPAMDQSPGSQPAVPPAGDLRGELIGAQSAELARLLDAGMITAATRRRLQLSLDLEAAQLTDRQQ